MTMLRDSLQLLVMYEASNTLSPLQMLFILRSKEEKSLYARAAWKLPQTNIIFQFKEYKKRKEKIMGHCELLEWHLC